MCDQVCDFTLGSSWTVTNVNNLDLEFSSSTPTGSLETPLKTSLETTLIGCSYSKNRGHNHFIASDFVSAQVSPNEAWCELGELCNYFAYLFL